MKYKVTDVIKEVRKVLEWNNESAPLIQEDDIDTLSLNAIAESKILDAIRFITDNAPVTLCGTGKVLNEPIAWEDEDKPGYGKGSIILPDDYLRLLTFQMTDWSRNVSIISDENALYGLQSSKHAGLRGNPEAPVVAICHYPEGLVLEFYTCNDSEATIKRASYMPLPSVDKYGFVEIPEKLKSAVVYYAGYLTALSRSAVSVANQLLSQAYTNAEMTMPQQEQAQQVNG